MSGEDACKIVRAAREEGRPVALAYVDVRMPPGIDGVETVRCVREIDAEVELVMMTAYTDRRVSDIVRNMELLHKLLYIRKPFAREEIQQITLSLVANGTWSGSLRRDAASSSSAVRGWRRCSTPPATRSRCTMRPGASRSRTAGTRGCSS